jgi:transposase
VARTYPVAYSGVRHRKFDSIAGRKLRTKLEEENGTVSDQKGKPIKNLQ